MSSAWGFDRGTPIDRYYIENYLEARQHRIKGVVLEIGEPLYTQKFGGTEVERSEILDVIGAPNATYTCRLEEADEIPSDRFDCVVFTQTLQLIYDFRAGLRTLHRVLKPGGTLMMTTPGITRISQEEYEEGWYWSFTNASITRLLGELFAPEEVKTKVYGNVLAAIGFLHGLAATELEVSELEHYDHNYPVIVGAQAVK